MLQSVTGPETTKKVIGTSVSLVVAILSFVAMALIVISAANPLWHVHFWPGIAILILGGSMRVVEGKTIRLVLSILVVLLGMWVLLNSIGGWIIPTAPGFDEIISGDAGLGELIAPVLLMLAGLGGVIGAIGGLIGVFGALNYQKPGGFMLEAMLGTDKLKSLQGHGVMLAAVVVAFVAMALIAVASVNPVWHVHFWPGAAIFLFASGLLVVKGKTARLTLSIVVALLGLWIILNVALGISVPAAAEMEDFISGDASIPEMMAPTLAQLAFFGGIVGAFAGLVGLFGALRYQISNPSSRETSLPPASV